MMTPVMFGFVHELSVAKLGSATLVKEKMPWAVSFRAAETDPAAKRKQIKMDRNT